LVIVPVDFAPKVETGNLGHERDCNGSLSRLERF
jgi:hypothetical protein